MVRGFYKLIGLLAAVTLEKIHRIYRYCVASNVVFVHGGLLTFSAVNAGPPLYTPNHSHVITPHLVVWACCGSNETQSTTPGVHEESLSLRESVKVQRVRMVDRGNPRCFALVEALWQLSRNTYVGTTVFKVVTSPTSKVSETCRYLKCKSPR